MRNVGKSVFNSSGGNVEPSETIAPLFVIEISPNCDNSLMVELSVVKGDKERISKSINLCKRWFKKHNMRLLIRMIL